MENSSKTKKFLFKSTTTAIIFVLSIIIIGVSGSYAYYVANLTGTKTVETSTAAKLNVTTTLSTADTISAAKLAIIDAADYLTKGEKVSFSVTNNSDSNVKAKYTVKLTDMSLTKNLFSKYFKYDLIRDVGTANEQHFTGTFADATVTAEGTTDTTAVTGKTKEIITDANAVTLDINTTDTLVFYIWLENDAAVSQNYLTNGSFSAKISMDAIPTK